MIELFVGEEKRTFAAHKNLLVLHSEYLRNILLDPDADHKILLPQFDSTTFAKFLSYLYSGEFNDGYALATRMCGEETWMLGQFLRAPHFQNYSMYGIITEVKNEPNHFMYVNTIEAVYRITRASCNLRRFYAECIAAKNPLQEHPEGSKEHSDWRSLFERNSHLRNDLAIANGKKWNGTFPWDDKFRQSYMEETIPLEEIWDTQILSEDKSKAEIKKAAEAGDFLSKIKLAHLDRKK